MVGDTGGKSLVKCALYWKKKKREIWDIGKKKGVAVEKNKENGQVIWQGCQMADKNRHFYLQFEVICFALT